MRQLRCFGSPRRQSGKRLRKEEARRRAEEAERRAEVGGRLDDAGAFFARGAYSKCLVRMEGLDAQAAAVGLMAEVTELRQAVAAALTAEEETVHQEEVRRQRVRAQEAGALAAEGRSLAEESDAQPPCRIAMAGR